MRSHNSCKMNSILHVLIGGMKISNFKSRVHKICLTITTSTMVLIYSLTTCTASARPVVSTSTTVTNTWLILSWTTTGRASIWNSRRCSGGILGSWILATCVIASWVVITWAMTTVVWAMASWALPPFFSDDWSLDLSLGHNSLHCGLDRGQHWLQAMVGQWYQWA